MVYGFTTLKRLTQTKVSKELRERLYALYIYNSRTALDTRFMIKAVKKAVCMCAVLILRHMRVCRPLDVHISCFEIDVHVYTCANSQRCQN